MSLLERSERADAARNRRRILDAAGELFAERGLEVAMDDIARAAGVGVGTVYRRFGDRGALIDALFEAKIDAVLEVAQSSLAIEDPWEGLCAFLTRTVELQAADRGLKEALLSADGGCARFAEAREVIGPLARRIVDRAKAAGALREDFDGFDLPMLQAAIGAVVERTRPVAPDYYRRIVTLVLDGMAARRDGVTAMPAAPLTPQAFRPC